MIDEAEHSPGVEQEEAGDAGVAVELAYGLGEDRVADGPLLSEALGLGEAAAVRGLAVADVHGVDHAVAVEEVVARNGLEEGVGAVADVDAVDEGGDPAGYGELVVRWLLAHGGEIPSNLDGGVGGLGQGVRLLEDAGDETVLNGVQEGSRGLLENVPFGLGSGCFGLGRGGLGDLDGGLFDEGR